jgi:hypothetical protein
MPQTAVPQDLLDHVGLRRLDEGDDHCPRAALALVPGSRAAKPQILPA